jgi:predicted DNA-binding transcriptional regulator AlpA
MIDGTPTSCHLHRCHYQPSRGDTAQRIWCRNGNNTERVVTSRPPWNRHPGSGTDSLDTRSEMTTKTTTAGSAAAYAALQDKLTDSSPKPVLEERHLTIDEVRTYVGGESKPLHAATIRDWIKTRGFSEPIKLSSNIARWKRSEVEAWIDQQPGRP